jgi:RNA polymerase sigma-70 factor (ECF subfamily)
VEDKVKRLIELHADRAYAIAFRLAGNRDDAGDLVQDAFLRAIKYMQSYDESLPFEAWLYQIIRNLYLNSLKLESRRKKVPLSVVDDDEGFPALENVLADPERGPEKQVEALGTKEAVQDALNGLSPTLRMAIILVDLEGMSREECARTLGCSLAALDVRLHRARALLRKTLTPYQEGKA